MYQQNVFRRMPLQTPQIVGFAVQNGSPAFKE
jgi:hypothetical protein